MSCYNPDQYTEPQSGLVPKRTLEELYQLFVEQAHQEYTAWTPAWTTIKLWEQFKEEVERGKQI